MLRLSNRKDIDTYKESVAHLDESQKLSGAFEAMSLYNMYCYATDFKASHYLYPYKLQKRIEIANAKSQTPLFSLNNRIYNFKGTNSCT